MNFTDELLCCLKERYEKTYFAYDSDMSSPQGKYYLKRLGDNLYAPMCGETMSDYKNGDGNELRQKMRALRSSSAMTYNLLGNSTIEAGTESIFCKGTYSIRYEYKLKTLKRTSKMPNLDAFLKGKHELIFCEMKMTEWIFNTPGKLSDAYLNKDNYCSPDIYEPIRNLIWAVAKADMSDDGKLYCRFSHYDAFQMVKHIIGIYNYAVKHDDIPAKIRLVNCIWHVPEDYNISEKYVDRYREIAQLEQEEFDMFYGALRPVIEVFRNIRDAEIDFDVIHMDAREFSEQFDLSPEHREYLKRYF